MAAIRRDCQPGRIPRAEIADYEGRIEYWGATEIVVVCDPVSIFHEQGGHRLGALTTMIAQTRVRGSTRSAPPASWSAARVASGNASCRPTRPCYLHPRATRPSVPAIEGSDASPDVVLEVDNTTDTRSGKPALLRVVGSFR